MSWTSPTGRSGENDCRADDDIVKQVLSHRKGSITNSTMVVHRERLDLGDRETMNRVGNIEKYGIVKNDVLYVVSLKPLC